MYSKHGRPNGLNAPNSRLFRRGKKKTCSSMSRPHDRKLESILACQLPARIDTRNVDLKTIGYLLSIMNRPFLFKVRQGKYVKAKK